MAQTISRRPARLERFLAVVIPRAGRGSRRVGRKTEESEMAVYKRGDVWWYKFRFAGRFIRESAKTASKTVAKEAERQRRRDLEEGYNNIVEVRDERVRPLKEAAASYLREYKLRNPRSAV